MEKNGKLTKTIKIIAILLIVIGIFYLLLDPIDRYLQRNLLGLFAYKSYQESIRDCLFASFSIIGGFSLLFRKSYSWVFLTIFSIGFIIKALFEIILSHFYRCNILDMLFLMPVVGLVVLILFNNRVFLNNNSIYRPLGYGYYIFFIVLIVSVINGFILLVK